MFDALKVGTSARGKILPSATWAPGDLLVICLISLLLVPSVAFSASLAPRIIVGLPTVFFTPGYSLLSALYPRRGDLTGVERLLLSFALSLAVVPLIGLGLDFSLGVTIYPILASLILFIVAMSGVAWWRRQALSPNTRFALSLPSSVTPVKLQMIRDFRLIRWLLLLVLTALVLLFPVKLTLDPSPVESVHIFASFPLFAALFLAWIGLLLSLLFFQKGTGATDWEGLALVSVSALVFVSFWVIVTPYGQMGDPLARLGDTVGFLETGTIPADKGIYFNFPGLFFVTAFVSHATGMDLFAISYLMRLFSTMLVAALLYLVYANLFRSAYLAPIVVMLALLVGKAPRIEFLSDLISGPLVLAFLVLLTRREGKMLDTPQDRILAILLLVAATISYFMDSLIFLLIPLGIYLTQWRAKERRGAPSILLLALVILFAWQVYWATSVFESLVSYLPALREQFFAGDSINTARIAGESAVGAAVPLWAIATRYFWWILFYGLGTILGLLGLLRAPKLTPAARKEVGGLLGVILLVGFATSLGNEGFQFNRYFTYAPLFIAPILVRLFLDVRQNWKRRSLVVLPVVLLVLALPTFLLDGSSVATNAVHPQDVGAGQFLQASYDDGDGLSIYGNQTSGPDISWYYTPAAEGYGPRGFHKLGGESSLWDDMEQLVEEFKDDSDNSIFVFSRRTTLGYYQLFGIEPTDPGWQHTKEALAGEGLIFDNGAFQIYGSPSGRGY